MKKKRLLISILTDNPRSWFAPFADKLESELKQRKHIVRRAKNPRDLKKGDCAFFLSVESIVPKEVLKRHTHNVVIHGSAVPKGKGWSPLAWQVLEGKNEIAVSLFEAAERVDSGNIYDRQIVRFDGSELIDELRKKEAAAITALALRFIDTYPPGSGKAQRGKESFYLRRTPEDSEIDARKTVLENFNLLRIVDNERYPAFFKHKGHTYILKVYKKK